MHDGKYARVTILLFPLGNESPCELRDGLQHSAGTKPKETEMHRHPSC